MVEYTGYSYFFGRLSILAAEAPQAEEERIVPTEHSMLLPRDE